MLGPYRCWDPPMPSPTPSPPAPPPPTPPSSLPVMHEAVGGGGGNPFDHFNHDGFAGGITEICTRSFSDQLSTLTVNYAGYDKTHGDPGGRRRSRRRWIG